MVQYSKTNQRILDRLQKLPLGTLIVFGIKQGWAALYGGLLLVAIIATSYINLPWLSRYDWLFIIAVLIQIGMIVFKLEKPRELIIIFLFHFVGLCMELFKTSSVIGSWQYPEDSMIRIATVPLFSGFMYAAVGSYMARVWRVTDFSFTRYPKRSYTAIIALAIYINFFTHHFYYDMRYVIFVCLAFLYGRTVVCYTLNKSRHKMPLMIGFLLVSLFIWFAENIGTFTKAWLYPNQINGWQVVDISKLGSWFLLMIISFIMVDLIHRWYQKRGESVV